MNKVILLRIRTYTELRRLESFEERFEYLKLNGEVGRDTFGYDRWMNQEFYTSSQWRTARTHVIARDLGLDLGVEGYPIHDKVFVHHMNPISASQLIHGDDDVLDPEYLITVSFRTHNAIHYGDAGLLPQGLIERRPGDTIPWRR